MLWHYTPAPTDLSLSDCVNVQLDSHAASALNVRMALAKTQAKWLVELDIDICAGAAALMVKHSLGAR